MVNMRHMLLALIGTTVIVLIGNVIDGEKWRYAEIIIVYLILRVDLCIRNV